MYTLRCTKTKEKHIHIHMCHQAQNASFYMATKSPIIYKLYCQARNTLCTLTQSLCYAYEKKLADNSKSNMKQFWKYVNSCLKSCPVIDSLRKSDDSITNSDEEKAKIFNEFFTSMFTHENTSFIPTFQLNKEIQY